VTASLAGRRVLVTGGAGFIGGALTGRLVAAGARVTVVDDLTTGFERNVAPGATFVRADVADADAMRAVFAAGAFDVVLHLAAQVSNIVSQKDPWLDFRTNVGGTMNVLEGLATHRIPRLIYASSMALYGTPEVTPTPETAALQPLSPYGLSKLAAELLVHGAADRPGLALRPAVTSLRMFNVYGPGQSLQNLYQGVVSVFIASVLAGAPIRLFGDGRQTRDFVYVEDVLDAWMAAIDDPGTYGRRINLGSGTEVSINAILDAVLAAFGHDRSTYPVQREPELAGDQRHICADVALAREVLGWQARWTLAEGLKETIEWSRTEWTAAGS
jgi:UDP-glucose 4-epimerase